MHWQVNNIHAHRWVLFIANLSAVSNLTSPIILVSWMGGIKAKSMGSPMHCAACIFFFALLHLGACLQACFLFFLTVSDSPISELQALQEHTC